jgi:hypothetical protein
MGNFRRKLPDAMIIILTIEKSAQHLLSALFFLVDVPGIGKPDTGPVFHPSFEVMALLNIIFFGAFTLGLLGRIRQADWVLNLIGGFAALDILLEIAFHGLFFLTVSVVVSTLLLISIFYQRKNHVHPHA